jgi:hypothetical protein
LILTARESVHIEDRVQPCLRTVIDYAVDETEALGLYDGRVEVVHEVTVIDGNADTVHAQ